MRKLFLTILILSLFMSMVSCKTNDKQRYSAQFLELFDTVTQVVAYTDNKEEFSSHVDQIYNELDDYHKLFDIYNDYEGINNIKTMQV